MKKQRKKKEKFDPTVPIVLGFLLALATLEIARGDAARCLPVEKMRGVKTEIVGQTLPPEVAKANADAELRAAWSNRTELTRWQVLPAHLEILKNRRRYNAAHTNKVSVIIKR